MPIKIKQITLNLGFVSIAFEEEELDNTLKAIVDEMRDITSNLDDSEKNVLRKIMAEHKPLPVTAVFPDFQRDTPEHETLRKLRDAQFIRPDERGRWKADKHIAIKPFGQMMWDKIGEEKLFNA